MVVKLSSDPINDDAIKQTYEYKRHNSTDKNKCAEHKVYFLTSVIPIISSNIINIISSTCLININSSSIICSAPICAGEWWFN